MVRFYIDYFTVLVIKFHQRTWKPLEYLSECLTIQSAYSRHSHISCYDSVLFSNKCRIVTPNSMLLCTYLAVFSTQRRVGFDIKDQFSTMNTVQLAEFDPNHCDTAYNKRLTQLAQSTRNLSPESINRIRLIQLHITR